MGADQSDLSLKRVPGRLRRVVTSTALAGVCGVAAPVRWSVSGPVAAAIATCVPASRFRSDFDFLRDRVMEASAMASEALGAAL